MKKRLYVPHPGHFDGLEELVSGAGKDLHSIFIVGYPDYVGNGRSNLSSPRIEDIGAQNLYVHKNNVVVELVLNGSCPGGRQLTPAEKWMPKQKRKLRLFSSVTSANTTYTLAGSHPFPSGHRSCACNILKNKKQIFKR